MQTPRAPLADAGKRETLAKWVTDAGNRCAMLAGTYPARLCLIRFLDERDEQERYNFYSGNIRNALFLPDRSATHDR